MACLRSLITEWKRLKNKKARRSPENENQDFEVSTKGSGLPPRANTRDYASAASTTFSSYLGGGGAY